VQPSPGLRGDYQRSYFERPRVPAERALHPAVMPDKPPTGLDPLGEAGDAACFVVIVRCSLLHLRPLPDGAARIGVRRTTRVRQGSLLRGERRGSFSMGNRLLEIELGPHQANVADEEGA
jgi:hypothetical protein